MKWLVVACLGGLVLAGCAGTPDENTPGNSPPPACGGFVTVHYEKAPEQARLRDTFEQAQYSWEARSDRIAEARSPGGGVIVLSHRPGTSGDDLILSATGAEAQTWAAAGAALVNATSGEARVKEWIRGNNC